MTHKAGCPSDVPAGVPVDVPAGGSLGVRTGGLSLGFIPLIMYVMVPLLFWGSLRCLLHSYQSCC
jgi:hypothetical protein